MVELLVDDPGHYRHDQPSKECTCKADDWFNHDNNKRGQNNSNTCAVVEVAIDLRSPLSAKEVSCIGGQQGTKAAIAGPTDHATGQEEPLELQSKESKNNADALNYVDTSVEFLESNAVEKIAKQDLGKTVEEGAQGADQGQEAIVINLVFSEGLEL